MKNYLFVLASINDMLDADIFSSTGAIILLIALVIAIPIGIALSKKTNEAIYGSDNNGSSITKLSNVKIISKKTSPHPLNASVMVNYIVAECEYGKRMEFAIRDINIFGIIVEGDVGTLTYQGNKFINFVRN